MTGRLLPTLLLLAAVAGCSSGSGTVDVQQQLQQAGPLLQACTELRMLDLADILDAARGILDDPDGSFEFEVDLDRDGAPDVTVSGEANLTGPDTVAVTWNLAGAIEGSGNLTATLLGDGAVRLNGTGTVTETANPDLCSFEFTFEDFEVAPAQLAASAGDSVFRGTVRYRTRRSRSTAVDMIGTVRCQSPGATGPFCATDVSLHPRAVLSGADGTGAVLPWQDFCFGPRTDEPVTIDPALLACGSEQAQLMAGLLLNAASLLDAAQGGSLPPGVLSFAPILQTAEPFDFRYELNLGNNVTADGTIQFPRDPSGAFVVGDEITLDATILGDPPPPSGALSATITVRSLNSLAITSLEAAINTSDGCTLGYELDPSGDPPEVRFDLDQSGNLVDIVGGILVTDFATGGDVLRAVIFFRTGPNVAISGVRINGVDVPNGTIPDIPSPL